MKSFRRFIRTPEHIILAAILLIAGTVRMAYLDRVPTSLTGDELTYIATARSIVANGTDLAGGWHPWELAAFRYPQGETQAELPYILFLPAVWLMPPGLAGARITNAILGIGTVWMLYLIAKKLFGRNAAFGSALLLALNPWSVFISRTSYESPAAIFFLLSAFGAVIYLKRYAVATAAALSMAAFYSYIGIKPIVFPFFLILMVFGHLTRPAQVRIRQAAIGSLILLFLSVFWFLRIQGDATGVDRTTDLFLPTDPSVTARMSEWAASYMDSPITKLFTNRGFHYARITTEKFLNIFSPSFLFLHGDEIFGIWKHGLYYPFESVLMITGLVFLVLKNRKGAYAVFACILLGTLPQLMHRKYDNFSQHTALVFPFLSLLSGAGLAFIIDSMKRFRAWIGTGLIFILALSAANFFFTYFHSFPLETRGDFDHRLAARYIQLTLTHDAPVIVYSTRAFDTFKKYLLYSGTIKPDTTDSIRNAIAQEPYMPLGNLTFQPCDENINPDGMQETLIVDGLCGQPESSGRRMRIGDLKDAHRKFAIYNPVACDSYVLRNYITHLTFRDLDIDRMDEQRFCETFILND